jgi:hypothetical protein
MIPPLNAELLETEDSIIWIDDDGIVNSISKKAPVQTIEKAKENLEKLKEITKGKKRCFLVDISEAQPSNREVQEFAAQELPKITKAMAIISRSALGVWVSNVFFVLKKQPYPMKMFTNEDEAKKWLKKYC